MLWGSRVAIPKPGRAAIVEELHGGHPGIVRMKTLARSYVWWPGMSEELELQVKNCPQCQETQNAPPPAPTHTWEWPKDPWSRIHLDFAGPFQGPLFLVLVDAGSKWLEVVPMETTTATATIAKLRAIFALHGLPERVVTDNVPQFISQEFQDFLKKMGLFTSK